jgi:hypothetical protein
MKEERIGSFTFVSISLFEFLLKMKDILYTESCLAVKSGCSV